MHALPGGEVRVGPEGAGSGPGRPRRRARDAGRERAYPAPSSRPPEARRLPKLLPLVRERLALGSSWSPSSTTKGPPPAYLQVTGPRSRSAERRMGDSNPRGLSPNTLSKCLNGGGKCSLACVAAGQRGARMVRTTPGWGWIGKNCYQNCYRCADHGNGVSAPRDLVMRRVSRAASWRPRS